MAVNQKPTKNKSWMWLAIVIAFGIGFLGLLFYCVSSDNKEIEQYSKQWRSTGDKEASMPMDMSNMNHAGMSASEMQQMDMSEMKHDKK
ncbi:hypothetical protein [Acinetobacter sp. MD2(2019)]|uniref:hypothetical protein n=1 Tax=Acinetobacter sp. MD2(2019) TaxID=2605273 RepID=UPI002D1EFDD2|nr:hypothetical protein [Acinetobacter sp. MD2(2019)]MEB3754537.1 hypothetical protein [Acinetobacter sp. MD2(2019)]